MVVPPVTGGNPPAPAAVKPSTSRMGATPIHLGPPAFPYSARRAPILDLKTVERKGHSSARNPQPRTRPHGLLEAPTFRPTEAEFRDPMTYIRSIFEKGSKFGICKIVPPDNWNPDFAIDTEVRRAHKRPLDTGSGSYIGRALADIMSRDSISVPDVKRSTLLREVRCHCRPGHCNAY